jgi:predicted amidohydrolase YtcJ
MTGRDAAESIQTAVRRNSLRMFASSRRASGALVLLASTALASTIPADAAHAQADVEPADLILSRGEIYLRGGWAESLAVKDGVIVAVGDDATVRALAGANTRVIALDGATVLPGLHDTHVHPLGSGLAQRECRFPQGSSLDVVQEAIRACVGQRGDGEWITGGQWDAASIGSAPDRAMLDAVAPDNPVALIDISYHSYWLNSRALELAGITAETPDPEGGVIERDATGAPTGVLRETARGLVAAVLPPVTAEENVEALKWSLDTMLALGITAFADAGVDDAALEAYAALADRGELKLRVRGCIRAAPGGSNEDLLARANLYASDRFSPDCVKLVLDGVPTDGHTAAMVEPYADASLGDDSRARGILMIPQATLNEMVVDLDARGYTVKMHAAGDAAVRAGLDAIEAARAANGFTGELHDVSHNSFVQMSDIARARAIGATFEMSPYIWFPNPIIPDIAKAIGPERMERWTPVKDAVDAGALVVPGSDWAVVPSVNPWIGIETLVTRQAPGGGGEMLGAVERITLEQAIDLYTVNSARQMGRANETGRIAPGLLADVIVLDRNPFEIPITEVHLTKVTMALINGDIVYEAAAP